MVRFSFRSLSWLGLWLALTGFGISQSTTKKSPPSIAEAKAFIDEAEARLMALSVDASRANWVQSTHITEDTEILSAQANERAIAAGVAFAKRATRFDGLNLPGDMGSGFSSGVSAGARPTLNPWALSLSKSDSGYNVSGSSETEKSVSPKLPQRALSLASSRSIGLSASTRDAQVRPSLLVFILNELEIFKSDNLKFSI